jgi:hypothetical protein
MSFGAAPLKREGTCVWVGDYGYYVIPSHLQAVRMTRHGWPDKRYTEDYRRFMQWVQKQEEKAKKGS